MPTLRMRLHRGSALLISLILMVVLAVVGLAVVNRTTREVDAVAAKRHFDRARACAEGARQMLLSRFRTYGLPLSSLTLQQTIGDQIYATGHYDQFNVGTVTPSQATSGSVVATGVVNTITAGGAGGGLGSQGWRYTVVCGDSQGLSHQQEVEFLVVFGF